MDKQFYTYDTYLNIKRKLVFEKLFKTKIKNKHNVKLKF